MSGYEISNQPDFGKESPLECVGECQPEDCSECKVMDFLDDLDEEELSILRDCLDCKEAIKKGEPIR